MNSSHFLNQAEVVRRNVWDAIFAGDDKAIRLGMAQARELLEAHQVAAPEDLDHWWWSDHTVSAIADFNTLPLFLLYKNLLNASRVDRDSGVEIRPMHVIALDTFAKANLGFLLTVCLKRDALLYPANALATSIERNIGSWTKPDDLVPLRRAYADLCNALLSTPPNHLNHWVLTQGLLQRPDRAPFLPFVDLDSISDKWLLILRESLIPYVRIAGGFDRCELTCNWNEASWVLVGRNRDFQVAGS